MKYFDEGISPKSSVHDDIEFLCHKSLEKSPTDKVIFERMESLLYDLKKTEVEIEDGFQEASNCPLPENTYEIKRKLENIKTEYLNILNDVEKGHKKMRKMKTSLENLNYSTHDSKNTKFVYQVRTTKKSPGRMSSAHSCSHGTRSRSIISRQNIINLETENQELKKQIQRLQGDLAELWSSCRKPSNRIELKQKNCPCTPACSYPDFDPERSISSDFITKRAIKESTDSRGVQSQMGLVMSTDDILENRYSSPSSPKDSILDSLDTNFSDILCSGSVNTYPVKLSTERKKSIEEIKKELILKNKDIKRLQETLKSLEKAYKKETDRLKTSKTQEVDVSRKLLQKNYEYDEMLAENLKIKKELDEANDEIRTLERTNQKLNKETEFLAGEKRKLLEDTAALANRLQMLQEDGEKYVSNQKKLRNLYDKERKAHETTKKDLSDVRKEYLEQKKKINLFCNERNSAKNKVAELETTLDQMTKKFNEKINKSMDLETTTNKLQEELESNKKEYEEKLSDPTLLQNSELNKQLEAPNKEKDDLIKQIEELKKSNLALKDKSMNATSQIDLEKVKLEMAKKQKELEDQIKNLTGDIEMLKNNKKNKEIEIRKLEEKVTGIKKDKECAECKVKEMENIVKKTNEAQDKLNNRLKEMEKIKFNLVCNVDRTTKELYCLKKENVDLATKLNQVIRSRTGRNIPTYSPEYCKENQNIYRLTFYKNECGPSNEAYKSQCGPCNEAYKNEFEGQFHYNQFNATVEHSAKVASQDSNNEKESGQRSPHKSKSGKEIKESSESSTK